MSTRLGDNEQLLNEEAEAGAVIKEFSAIAAEATPKWDASTIDISRGFASTISALQRELTIHKSLFLSESSTPVEDDGGEEDGMGALGNVEVWTSFHFSVRLVLSGLPP